jgi:hypothetical protein
VRGVPLALWRGSRFTVGKQPSPVGWLLIRLKQRKLTWFVSSQNCSCHCLCATTAKANSMPEFFSHDHQPWFSSQSRCLTCRSIRMLRGLRRLSRFDRQDHESVSKRTRGNFRPSLSCAGPPKNLAADHEPACHSRPNGRDRTFGFCCLPTTVPGFRVEERLGGGSRCVDLSVEAGPNQGTRGRAATSALSQEAADRCPGSSRRVQERAADI